MDQCAHTDFAANVTVEDNRIKVNEAAMLPDVGYSIQLGEERYEIVKRSSGTLVMYQIEKRDANE